MYIKNRPATFEYPIEDRITAGIMLTASEIKSIRNGKVSFNDSYCLIQKGEVWIKSLTSYYTNHKVPGISLGLHRDCTNTVPNLHRNPPGMSKAAG